MSSKILKEIEEMTGSMSGNRQNLTIFYDGSCPLCTAEIGHYKQADTNGDLNCVDVSSAKFEGDAMITQQAAMERFHVRLVDGQQFSGARGFVEVWRTIPSWQWLARLSDRPSVLPVLELVYSFSLHLRPITVRVFKAIHSFVGRNK